MKANKIKISVIGFSIALTLGIHYGWILEPIFGDSHWIHAIHGRFCYIPIVIAAAWFGLRGGLISAALVSALVLPFIFMSDLSVHNQSGEWVEIIFYFAIGALTGAIIDRELLLRKKHEETKIHLERSHKLSMVGQMTASIAHEIKNPLASIKGGVEIMCDDSTPKEQQAEFKTIVFNEIKRMDNTIKEFLNFARPNEIKMERLNLSELIKMSTKQLEQQAAQKQVTIISDSSEDVEIYADREKMHQVILNLMLNAVDASSANDKIVIKTSSLESKGLISIKDDGDGIDSELIDKIFDPFYTTKTSGTGLGLAVVKSIVEDLKGAISIASQKDQGTTVTLTFPLYQEDNQ